LFEISDSPDPQIHSFPVEFLGATATLVGDKYYIIGYNRNSKMAIIDPENLTFEFIDSKVQSRYHQSFVYQETKIVCFGGIQQDGGMEEDVKVMNCFDTVTRTWSEFKTSNSIQNRSKFTLTQDGKKVYVMGGLSKIHGVNTLLDSLHVLDLDNLTWYPIQTSLGPIGRYGSTSFLHKGILYIFGGCDNRFIYGDLHCVHLNLELNPLACDVRKLFNSPNYSDVTFHIQGKQIHAHKVILSARSEELAKIVHNEDKVINLNVNYEAFYLFLEFLYIDEILSTHILASTSGFSTNLMSICGQFSPNLKQQLVQSATRLQFNRQPSTYQKQLESMYGKEDFVDCTFLVGTTLKKVRAHKAIVCSRCDYLRGLFSSGLKESTQSEIPLDISEKVFERILSFLYGNQAYITPHIPPNTLPYWLKNSNDPLSEALLAKLTFSNLEVNLDFNFIQELLEGANLYMVDSLKSAISNELVKLVEENHVEASDLLVLAKTYNLEELSIACDKK